MIVSKQKRIERVITRNHSPIWYSSFILGRNKQNLQGSFSFECLLCALTLRVSDNAFTHYFLWWEEAMLAAYSRLSNVIEDSNVNSNKNDCRSKDSKFECQHEIKLWNLPWLLHLFITCKGRESYSCKGEVFLPLSVLIVAANSISRIWVSWSKHLLH